MLLATLLAMAAASPDQLLRATPMLATHDAATGYMGSSDVRRPWMQTQLTPFSQQASCGSRAFDLRLGKYDEHLRLHHGSFFLWDQTVAGTMAEMVAWASAHPSELVLMMGSHCTQCDGINVIGEGSNCHDAACSSTNFTEPFVDQGIAVITDCAEFASLTLESALGRSALPGGGHVLAVMDCVDSNYGPAENIGWGRTLVSGQSSEASFAQLFSYFDASLRTSWSSTWWLQAIWQEAPSLRYDPLQSIHDYTSNSQINARVLARYQAGNMTGANVILVNEVCDHGPALAAALGATVSAADQAACSAACTGVAAARAPSGGLTEYAKQHATDALGKALAPTASAF
jgi:hypothetical protein